MKKHVAHPLVMVEWDDAHSPDATAVFNVKDLGKVHGSLRMTSVGWLLLDDEKGVTIANEDCGDGDFRGLTFVPRALVVAVRRALARRARAPSPPPSPAAGQGPA